MKHKHFSLLVVLLLAGVAGCGSKATPTPAPVPTEAAPPTQPPDKPAVQLGETYRNEAGGFAFRAIPGYELATFGGMVNRHYPK